MPGRISDDALEFLAFLTEFEFPLKPFQEVGQLGQELIDAGYAKIYIQEKIVPLPLIALPAIVPQSFLVPTTVYQSYLELTPQGVAYLRKHQGDLERIAEA